MHFSGVVCMPELEPVRHCREMFRCWAQFPLSGYRHFLQQGGSFMALKSVSILMNFFKLNLTVAVV